MTDEILVEKSLRGERNAFGKLYERYAERIYRFAYYRTWHREAAEDVTATAFMTAFEKLRLFDPARGSFRTWLYVIAAHGVADHFRDFRVEVDIDSVWDLQNGENIPLDAERREEWEKVGALLSKLPREKREIVMMRLWDNLSFAEIGAMLGKTPDSCKMSFSRTVATLRENLSLVAAVWSAFLIPLLTLVLPANAFRMLAGRF